MPFAGRAGDIRTETDHSLLKDDEEQLHRGQKQQSGLLRPKLKHLQHSKLYRLQHVADRFHISKISVNHGAIHDLEPDSSARDHAVQEY